MRSFLFRRVVAAWQRDGAFCEGSLWQRCDCCGRISLGVVVASLWLLWHCCGIAVALLWCCCAVQLRCAASLLPLWLLCVVRGCAVLCVAVVPLWVGAFP